MLLFGVMKRAKRRGWIQSNPSEDVERVSIKRSGDFNVLSPVEVQAVARAVRAPETPRCTSPLPSPAYGRAS